LLAVRRPSIILRAMTTTMRVFSVVIVAGLVGCGGGSGSTGGAGAGGSSTGTGGKSAGGGGAGGTAIGSGGAGGAKTTGGGSCGTVEPCGGSVLGTWKIENTCLLNGGLVADASAICPTATLVSTAISGTGMATWAADGTYHASGTLAATFELTIPNSCFAPDKSCASVDAEMRADPTVSSAGCATSGSACVCQFTTIDGDQSGTWSTSGTTLTQTPTGGSATSDPYCVVGNELHDIALDMSMAVGSMGMAKIVGDVVYTRQ
jgi:hypothetical protein